MSGASRLRMICVALGVASVVSFAPAVAAESDEVWGDIREMLFADRKIQDGTGVIHLAAPQRAHDAAIVPIEIVADIPQTTRTRRRSPACST